MAADEDARRRAGQTIYQERSRRGWSVEAAMELGGIGHMTWRRIERGDPVQAKSYRAVDHAFGWPLGHTHAAIDAGGDLVNAEGQPLEPPAPYGQSDRESQPLLDVENTIEQLSYVELKEIKNTVNAAIKSYQDKITTIRKLLRVPDEDESAPTYTYKLKYLTEDTAKQYISDLQEYGRLCHKMSDFNSEMLEVLDDQQVITMSRLNEIQRAVERTREELDTITLRLAQTSQSVQDNTD